MREEAIEAAWKRRYHARKNGHGRSPSLASLSREAVAKGTLLRGASSITTGAEDPEVTGGNEAWTASDAYPSTGSIESTGRVASAVAAGDVVSTARTSVVDIAGPAKDFVWDFFVNGHATESRRWVEEFDSENTAAPATDSICTGPGARPLVLVAASYDQDSQLR